MLPDRVSNPGPLTYESGALPIAQRGPAMTDAASEILWKERRRKKPWVTKDVLELCGEKRDFKKKRYKVEGRKSTG